MAIAIPLTANPLQSLFLSPLHHNKTIINSRRKKFTVVNSKLRHHHRSFNTSVRLLCPPLKSAAAVNGEFSVGGNVEEDGEKKVEIEERVRRLVGVLRSIMPGGSWWSLTGDVQVPLAAKPVTVWRALGRMWNLVARDRWVIFAAFSALVLTALSEISIPHFLTASIFSAQSGKVAVFHRNVHLMAILCITSGICSGVRSCCFSIANMILVKRVRETLYSALLFQEISFFDSQTVGDLTSRLGADCQQVSRVIGNDLNLISRNVLQGGRGTHLLANFVVAAWPLYFRNMHSSISHYANLWPLSLNNVHWRIYLIHRNVRKRYQKKSAKIVQEYAASANEVAQETFSLMRTVRVYGTEKPEIRRYKRWLKRIADVTLRQSAAYGLWNLSFNTLYHSTQVVAVLVGGTYIMNGQITAEQLTKFILYSEWLIYSTWWVGDNLSSLMQSVGASEKVFQLMDLLPSDQFVSKGSKLQKMQGHIEFVDLSFYYPSRPTVKILHDVKITVHPNEVVAIVGLSGSGKSTLVNLLLRLYEPTSGQILIDGFPLKELDIRWFRQRVGYVGQEPRLFRMDISSNIRYGCTRDITQQDIEWAAKQAYAHDFISLLPNGYATLVDDDLLSGGQKQRIAIARAILRDPSILILDEATSALDAESEHNVKGILSSVKSDSSTKRSVIVIAHRLSTIQAADRIVVMDGGQVVEMGTHTELLKNDGLYARLNKRQADAVA